MAKRIFKIMGIVFGAVLGFVGIVIGVMAAMGKFKTPVVFPTGLEFLENDVVVIQGNTYNPLVDWETQFADEDNRPTIQSFVLTGTNKDAKHEVNKKDCYIWFYETVGEDLITLCDENGVPLEANEYNYYLVQCNEPIYYMVNELEEDAVTDGKVQIQAKSANNKALVDQHHVLTFWIDREVDGVYVDSTLGESDRIVSRNPNVQEIEIGSGLSFDFNYKAETPLSLKPIEKESAKEVELYYVATDYSTDYVRVTKEEVENTNSPLNKILTHEDGVFTFKSDVASMHTFYIATFKTYKYKQDYLQSIEGLTINNPNYHRLNGETEDEVKNMAITELKITVQPIEVSEVIFMGTNVVLNLYSQNDYITLDGVSGIDGAKDNNLELSMKKGKGANVVADYSRFNEVSMAGFDDNSFVNKYPKFEASTDQGIVEWEYQNDLQGMVAEKSNVKIGENLTVINYMYEHTDELKNNKYYCVNGVAVYDETHVDPVIRLLKPGSYLNFYTQDADNDFELYDLECEINSIGEGRTKSWQIISKEMPDLTNGTPETDDDLKLTLGILVVNSQGEFKINQFFDSIPVAINEVELNCEYLNRDVDLNITFEDAVSVDYDKVSFNELVRVNAATYQACVLVVEEKVVEEVGTDEEGAGAVKEKAVYNIDVLPKIKFNINDKTYVLVGYEENGQFVNNVRASNTVNSSNKTCEIFVLQLINGYDDTINTIIDPILEEIKKDEEFEKVFDSTQINKILNNYSITVNSNYILNTALLNYQYYDRYQVEGKDDIVTKTENDLYVVYENTDDHTIVITSSNEEMISKVVEFYNIDLASFVVDYDLNLELQSVTLVEHSLIVKYNAKRSLSDETLPITITLKKENIDHALPGVLIRNGSPETIILNAGNGNVVELSKTLEEAEASENFLKVVVGYDAKYVYSFYLNGTYQINENIFNVISSSNENVGFQDKVDKGQALDVGYDASNKSIFNTDNLAENLVDIEDLVEKSGETVLLVTIGGTTAYLKVVTDTSAFAMFTAGGEDTFEKEINRFTLDEYKFGAENNEKLINLKFNGTTEISLAKNKLVYIDNLRCISYGDGNLLPIGDKISGWALKKNIEDTDAILTITDTGTGWTFEKINPYMSLAISFDVETLAGTQSIVFTFTSNVNVSVNSAWSNNRTFYAGTKVLMHSQEAGKVPVFNGINSNDFVIKVNDDEIGNIFEIDNKYIGNLSIQIYLKGLPILEFYDFVVNPNVIDSIESDSVFESETSYAVDEIYTLQCYKDITYGNSSTELYTSDNLISLTNITDLVIIPEEAYNINPVLEWDDADKKLSIDKMSELRVQKIREITLVYPRMHGDYVVVSTREITIENKHKLVPDEDITKEIKALKEYSTAFATVSGYTLQTMTADNLIFEIDAGLFTMTKPIIEEFRGVEVTLTFSNGTDELTYVAIFDVLPYSPEEKATLDSAFSGSSYDLFNGIYDVTSIELDANIKSLLVTAIYDENKNDITNDIIEGVFASSGYTRGQAEANCEIVFKEFADDEKDVLVMFELTYENDLKYSYPISLNIKNRQTIAVEYPENDEELLVGSVTFKFLQGYENEGAIITGNEANAEGVYLNKNLGLRYEPIAVFSDSSQIFSFKNDDVKKISRVEIENETINTSNSTSQELNKITVIGYQNNPGITEYVARINTTYDTNKISMPVAIQGMAGLIVLKLETASGNVEYYYVYVYCVGSSLKINEENNLKVVGYQNTFELDDYSSENVVELQIEEGKTFKDVLQALGSDADLFDNGENTTFLKVFGRTYNINTTSIYLYEGIAVGDTFDYDDNKWQKIDEESVVFDAKFNVVTIGLVYNSGVEKYAYGTITLYLQPTNLISLSDADVKYDVPNGEFTKEIAANSTSISSPFGTSWTATIISVNEVTYDGAVHTNYSHAGSIVSVAKRVAQDETIKVKYENAGTIAFVTYTYKATVLPEVTNSVVVGEFDENDMKFVNTIDLKSTTDKQGNVENLKYFFGTYNDTYSVNFDETGVAEWDAGTNIVTFTQTHEQQIVKATITYTNYGDGTETRTFTFVVRAGIAYKEDMSNGLTSANRAETIATDEFDSNVGSQLEIKYDNSHAANNVFIYEVAGLTIYTNVSSKLTLSFDKYSYVLNNGNVLTEGTNSISVTVNTNVDFVHLAKEENLTMAVKISKSDESGDFDTRNLYLTVVKTYTRLDATYLVDGADHENVKNEHSLSNLHNVLLNSNRIQLLGTEQDANGNYVPVTANLIAMGFATYGNPNFIKFTVGGNATIKNDPDNVETAVNTQINNVQIDFKKVTKNTECAVLLNNQAGMEENSVWYNYQIISGDYVDGLDFTTTNGYDAATGKNADKYVSFLMNAEEEHDDYFQKFIIGSMLDQRNTTTLILSVSGTSVDLVDEDETFGGYEDAIQYEFTLNSKTYYLTFDRQSGNIELISVDNIDTTQVVITLNLGGVNGAETIESGLKIVLTNHQLSGKFEDSVDTTIYSGDIIYLQDKINGYNNTISFELCESEYSVESETRTIEAGENNNDLFKFVDGKLETKAVGSLARANIVFLAKVNNYALKQIEYNFNVNLNMQFVVNGENLSDNIGNTTPETNFVLTNDGAVDNDETENFPIEIKFIAKQDFNEDNGDANEVYKQVGNYYNILVFDLYKLNIQGNSNALEKDKLMARENTFVIEPYSNLAGTGITIDKDKIIFSKDYTGDIELKLSVKTDNGTYYVIWTIHVYGIKTITYTSANYEFARLQNNALPFNSNTNVKLIHGEDGTDVGLVMENAPEFASATQQITKSYEYKIHTFNDTTRVMTNEALFTSPVTQYLQGESDEAETKQDTTNSLGVYLPSVPATDETMQSYLVTYKVVISYFNQTSKTFYVTYEVVNKQQVQVYEAAIGGGNNKSSADIMVDGTDANIDTTTNYLELFNFAEIYSVGGTEYIFTYVDGSLQLKIDETIYDYDSVDSTATRKMFKKDGFNTIIYDISNKKVYEIDLENELVGTWSKTQELSGKVHSVFRSDFTNIFAFKNFIDAYLNKTKDNDNSYVALGSYDFSLIHIADGRYGIDLASKFATNKFNNELNAEFNMIEKGVKTVTIPAYSLANTKGFRLTTNNKIKANTNNGEGVKLSTMFLPKYFESTAEGVAENVTLDTAIIGVGEPAPNWTNKNVAPTKPTPDSSYATITIGTGNVYEVKKVTYTSGSGTLYNLTESFYYLVDYYYLVDETESSKYVVPDYNAVGIESTFFKLTYIPNVADQNLDLTKAFKEWYMNAGSLDSKAASSFEVVAGNIVCEETSPTYDESAKVIKIATSTLDGYKKQHPNKKNYPTTTATISANGDSFVCEIVFALPDYVQLKTTYNAVTMEVELKNNLYIPDSTSATGYSVFSNVEDVKFISETSDGRYVQSYNALNGKITFDTAKIKEYFDNTSQTYLYITCKLTTAEDKTLDFQIVVSKT